MNHANHLYHLTKVVDHLTPEVNALTHTPPHHADEAFATAILSFLRPMTVYCTRDLDIIQSFDGFVYDVGGEYDHAKLRYDHHQRDFAESHPCGYRMAAAGLVWRHYGAEVVSKFPDCSPRIVDEVVEMLDESFFAGLDGSDNGQIEDGPQIDLANSLGLFNPNWDEDADPSAAFTESIAIAQRILERAIIGAISYMKGKDFVEAAIAKAPGRYFIMYKKVNSWVRAAVESQFPGASNLLYGITKDTATGTWRVRALPPDMQHQMQQRKKFPANWRGLSGAALAEVTGIETAQFCHASGFLAIAGTKPDAIRLAELAIAAPAED